MSPLSLLCHVFTAPLRFFLSPRQESPYINGVVTAKSPSPIRGSQFSDIFSANYHKERVCLKRIRIFEADQNRQALQQRIVEDAIRWQEFKHDRILPFIGIDKTTFTPMIALVTPWMEHNVIQYLKETENADILILMIEIVEGLVYLHDVKKEVHGDLRGANILIDGYGHVKLSDYGLAPHADEATAQMTTAGSGRGPGRWMAPELHYPEKFNLDDSSRTFASDIFALGMTMLEMYTLAPPFSYMPNDASVFLAIVNDRRPHRPNAISCRLGQAPDDTIWELIRECWTADPEKRPPATVIYQRLRSSS